MKTLTAIPLFSAFLLAGCAPQAAQVATPVAATTPAPDCNCTMVSVLFFDPGSAALSAKNRAVLQHDADVYAKQAQNPISVSAGADAQEAEFTPRVSFQRLQSVATQLVADGVSPLHIYAHDNGSRQPAEPTAPGVALAMNRYVTIQIHIAPPAAAATPTPTPTTPTPTPTTPAGVFQPAGVFSYESNDTLSDRLGADGVQHLNTYTRGLDASLTQVFAAAAPQPGVSAALVVGIKPDGAVKTWVVAPPGAFSPALIAQIQAAALTVPVLATQNGPVAFALLFNVWGGGTPVIDAKHMVPTPPEWTRGPHGPEQVPDQLFARIWP